MDIGMGDGWLRVEGVSSGGRKVKRKNPKSPFFFFMMEQKRLWEQQGEWQANWSMEKLVQSTLPLWNRQKEDPNFLEPYIEQHRLWKLNQKGDLEHKYDAMGRSLADIAREGQRQRRLVEQMEMEIKETVGEPGSKSRQMVHQTKFYVAHFNYLCRTDQDFYIPCEAAVVEFSLEEGVTRCWQEFLSPLDSIPRGYKYRCIKHARVTHNLTPEFEQYETNYKRVVASLVQFMTGKSADLSTSLKVLPPLYLMPGIQTEAGKCVTRFMLDQAGLASYTLRLFPLPKLIFALCPGLFPSVHLAEGLLEEDNYSHHAGLACWFHESLLNPHHCSLSVARRQIFSLLETASPSFPWLARLPGRHLPPPQDQVSGTSDPSSMLLVSNTSFVREERINRKIPNPGGITTVPATFDARTAVYLEGRKPVEFPGPQEGNPLPNWAASNPWGDDRVGRNERHREGEEFPDLISGMERNSLRREALYENVVSVRPKLNKENSGVTQRFTSYRSRQ